MSDGTLTITFEPATYSAICLSEGQVVATFPGFESEAGAKEGIVSLQKLPYVGEWGIYPEGHATYRKRPGRTASVSD